MSTPTSPTHSSVQHERSLATTTSRQSRRSPIFLTLPLEIHLLIAAALSFPSYLSLRLTHPHLYHALAAPAHPTPLRCLDQCTRTAIRTYLAPYLTTHRPHQFSSEAPAHKSSLEATTTHPLRAGQQPSGQMQQRCALCGNLYPLRLFKSAASPACSTQDLSPVRRDPSAEAQAGQEATDHGRERRDDLARMRRDQPDWDVVELPQRVCCWHVGRLTRVVRENDELEAVEGSGRKGNAKESGDRKFMPSRRTRPDTWISRIEQLCMHCGAIQAWRPCHCQCQSCSIRPARAYTRYAKQDWSCGGFVFWRDHAGNLWVRETLVVAATDVTESRTTYVDKLVIYE